MMKKYFQTLLLISSLFGSSLQAQNPAMEAKAAYLLAEESFEAGKYAECINYLDEAAQKLGAANAKILYLKVLALKALGEKDDVYFSKLTEAIDAFINAPDYDSFNEEKRIEISKLRIKIAKDIAAQPTNALEIYVWKQLQMRGWKMDMSIEELKNAFSVAPSPKFSHLSDGRIAIHPNKTGVPSFFMTPSKEYKYFLKVEYDKSYNGDDDRSLTKGTADWEEAKNKLSEQFGQCTGDSVLSGNIKSSRGYRRVAIWIKDNRQLTLTLKGFHVMGKSYMSTVKLILESITATKP